MFLFVIESGKYDGRDSEEPEHDYGKAGLKFAVHRLSWEQERVSEHQLRCT